MLGSLRVCATLARAKMQSFFTKENGEVNIVAIVVLCGIAILLAVFFRKEIEKVLASLFGTIQTSANNAIKEG
ncbi:MAG: flagellin-like protein [Oscillospiraceae bacterium]|nr:flagellin-like protein [Oscillospiraceae bacterium]